MNLQCKQGDTQLEMGHRLSRDTATAEKAALNLHWISKDVGFLQALEKLGDLPRMRAGPQGRQPGPALDASQGALLSCKVPWPTSALTQQPWVDGGRTHQSWVDGAEGGRAEWEVISDGGAAG